MQLRKHLLGLGLYLLLVLPVSLFAIDTHNTHMLSQPAISANHIAFIYAKIFGWPILMALNQED